MIAAIRRIFTHEEPIDWNARLEADRAMRLRMIGAPYAKRRAAALKGVGR